MLMCSMAQQYSGQCLGLLMGLSSNFKYTIGNRLRVEDVYLIFDRYYDYSTKCVTRESRATDVSRVHHLQVNNKLPAQKILLASSKNKKQLMQLIVSRGIYTTSQVSGNRSRSGANRNQWMWSCHPTGRSVEGILPAHALSGCDTVASYFGIGKATVLKTLRSGHTLNLLGTPGHSMEFVIQQATSFISACYGQTHL